MTFLKQNWFKLAVLLMLSGTSVGLFAAFPKRDAAPTPQVTEPTNSPMPSTPDVPRKAFTTPIDPTIQIEICRTQAKDYADKVAKRVYLLAFEEAQAAGDTKSARAYLEMSFKPEHPADYDSNYNLEYIKCLKQ